MKKNGYLVTGSTSNFGVGNYDAYCVRLDEQGKMLWSKTYGTSLSEVGTKCYGTRDGGFLLSFESHYPGSETDSSAFIVKCDPNGNVQWSKCIRDKGVGSFRPAYLYESKKGDVYLLYDWNPDRFYGTNFALLKFTDNGAFVWQKQVDTKPLSTFECMQVSELENGNLVVIGNSYGDNWATYGSYIHIFRFAQTDGALQQCKKICYGACGLGTYLSADNVVLQDSSFYVNGSLSSDDETGYKICWFPVSSGKGQITAHYIEYGNYHSYQYLVNKHIMKQPEAGYGSGLNFTPDGSYLNAYRYSAGSPTYYDIIVDKYDSLGRICPRFTIPAIDTVVKETTIHIEDKSYAILTNAVTVTDLPVIATEVTAQRGLCNGSADFIAGKITSSGMQSVTETGDIKLKLYPNPAIALVTISYEVKRSSDIQFTVTTTRGKAVLTKQLFATPGQQQTVLDIHQLPPGVYFIKVTGLDTIKAIKMVKQK